VLAARLARGRDRLAGAPLTLDLPADRPRPPAQSLSGARLPLALPEDLATGLAALARRAGATPFMGLLAAFQALLGRYSGREDLLVGSPAANRGRLETEGLIGCFVNTLVLRADLAADPGFAALLARTRRATLAAYADQDLPFAALVLALAPERDLSRPPVVQVVLALDTPPPPLAFPGLAVTPYPVDPGTAKFDLTLELAAGDSGLAGWLEYATDLFDAATVERLAGHFLTLLAAALADPARRLSALPLMAEPERLQVLVDWNRTARDSTLDHPVHERVAERARSAPAALAVRSGAAELSYGDLDAAAERLARRLAGLGVRPESRVGLLLPRSPELAVAALAVGKAGGAYLPIDPGHPPERWALLLADAGARVVVTTAALAALLPPGPPGLATVILDGVHEGGDGEATATALPADRPGLDGLAYVIYTSGSTGRPKGVLVSHAGLANLVGWHLDAYGVTAADRATLIAGVGFDASVWELWPYLVAGASLHLPDEETRTSPERLRDWLTEEGITLAFLPTPLAEALLALDWPRRPALRALLTGGDRLHRPPAAGSPFALINHYGPTEGAVVASAGLIPPGFPDDGPPSIGRPIANARIYLLDRHLEPVPAGIPGELWLAGRGLARGYLGAPELTAERFLPDVFGGPGERLYRTGDLARHRPDGHLDFLGRADQQVKVRGFRVEPGEVEAVLASHPAVAAAAVVAREASPGDVRLVGYVVARQGDPEPLLPELRRFLAERLPGYMVPAALVPLAALPLTANGKVDRQALPAPGWTAEVDFVAPRTPLEDLLAGIWAELLGVARVGVDDNFFALGGHSLLATRLAARVRATLGVELPLARLFAAPTVAGLARELTTTAAFPAASAAGVLRPLPRAGAEAPLSFAQERLWFLDRLEPGSAAYNLPAAFRLAGRLDLAALAASLGEVARRHETLRTTFEEVSGRPVQRIAPAMAGAMLLPLVDLARLPAAIQESERWRLGAAEAALPFDLARGPLLRAVLLRLAAEESVLLVTLHHIAADGWSAGVLAREVGALYAAFSRGLPSPLAGLPVQYADFAVWQRAWLSGEVLAGEIAHWRERLAGAPTGLDLPADRPRPAVRTARGGSLDFELPADLAAGLKTLSRRRGTTLFMTLFAGFAALLGRLTGEEDLLVGSPVANRTQGETEGLIGLFVNTLVLRGDLTGDPPFGDLLARVRAMALDAYAHQDLPFETLVAELEPTRDLARNPLFQVLFVLQNAPAADLALPGLKLTPLPATSGAAKLDLALSLAEQAGGGLAGTAEYSADLFDPGTVARLLGYLRTLLAGAAAEPGLRLADLPLLDPAELDQILRGWNRTAVDRPEGLLLHELFEAQAARTPRATALLWGEERVTYEDLDIRASAQARRLSALGVGPEVRVGLLASRSPALVAGALAVWKAGGAYVPLDPEYPRERLAAILADAAAPVLLAERRFAGLLAGSAARLVALDEEGEPEGGGAVEPREEAPAPERARRLAYVIYTSGSTGRPKGVAIEHRSAVELAFWARDRFSPAELSG
ncbi:MAG: hypothetical protein QOJ16_3335, partial [Acidobacteriota bacterium]|nr:hypothetical protein [Acidobacteriota bacterium]